MTDMSKTDAVKARLRQEGLYRHFIGMCHLSAESPLTMRTEGDVVIVTLGKRRLEKGVVEFLESNTVDLLVEMGVDLL